MRYIASLLIVALLGLTAGDLKFSGETSTTFDSIATKTTDLTGLSSNTAYLTLSLSGASYYNYSVQAYIGGSYRTIFTDSLGVGASGGFETILLRNLDSNYRFPYGNLRVTGTTNDPSGTITLKIQTDEL